MTQSRLVLSLFFLVGACTVSRPDPGAGPYRCAADADCLDGYSCVDRTALGEAGFCVPACDPRAPTTTCPEGICTDDGSCLDRCTVENDGTVTEGCGPGLTCVRTDALRDEGVCYQIDGCSVGSDCADVPGEPPRACVGDALGIPVRISGLPIASNALFCADAPQGPLGDRCPEGSVLLDAATPICLPTCSEAGERCPPSTTCLRDLGWYFGAAGSDVCFVGAWGSPCDDDTECFFGRCLDVGGRRACTERCDDVPFAPGTDGCSAIAGSTFYGPYDARCEDVAGTPTCVLRGEIGTPCGATMPCIDALQCFLVRGESTGVCTRGCMNDSDCWIEDIAAERRMAAYCDSTLSACLPRRRIRSACERDAQCTSNHCRIGLCTEL